MANDATTGSPKLVNMLTCDGTHRDMPSGKWTLLGIFNKIHVPNFPMVHPQMFVYMALADVEGKIPVRFQIVATDRRDEVLYKGDAEMNVNERQSIVELVIAARNISFARPADYMLQLYANDRFLGERSLHVQKI